MPAGVSAGEQKNKDVRRAVQERYCRLILPGCQYLTYRQHRHLRCFLQLRVTMQT